MSGERQMGERQQTGEGQKTGEGRHPGDPSARDVVAKFIRVDHAGEYGAKRIYQGQLAVLGRRSSTISTCFPI